MKAKCNKDLFMQAGQIKCFTKGKTYEVLYVTDEKMTLLDDDKAQHSIWMSTATIKNGWMEHFTVTVEITKSNENV